MTGFKKLTTYGAILGTTGSTLLAGVFAASLSGSVAAETDLVMSSWLPPRHPVFLNAIKPWAREIEKVTDGRVTVRVLGKPLGSPPAHFDMARDDVADITYGLHSFSQDNRFTKAEVGQFSFLGDNAIETSKAFYTVYTEDLDAEKDHEGTKLLGLFVHGPGLFHNNQRKINTPEDFVGLKIRVPGGYVGSLIESLGATPLFMSSTEVYEKLSRGVIDGATFTYEALTAFNLTDDLKFSMTVPGGIYNTTWFLVMNQGKWDSISDEDQAAIESISGLAFAERVGQAWIDADTAAISEIEASGIELFAAPEPVLDALKESADKLEKAWADGLPDGYDGTAAIERLRGITGVGQ